MLDKCCFCISLPTGAQIYGWIGAVFEVITIIMSITLAAAYETFVGTLREQDYIDDESFKTMMNFKPSKNC